MGSRFAGAGIGLVFGLTLTWSGMSSPDVIRGALLIEHSYLFLFFGSAVATAAIGLALLRRRERRALLADTPLVWTRDSPAPRHMVGSLLFGVGWGVADVCPGPILTQVGQGIGWAVFTLVGTIAGVYLFLRRSLPETEPPLDIAAASTEAVAPVGG